MPLVTHSENPGARAHLANLDVLRALAVLAVLFHHTKALTGFAFPFLGEVGGLLGVQLFFLISGYLITESANKYTLREYAIHRFFRIFPAYLFVYFAFGLYLGIFTKPNVDLVAVTLNLLNLQQLSPKALIEYDVVHVSWTLTVELLWYLVAPILVILFGRKRMLPLLLCAALVSSAWSFLASTGTFDSWFSGSVAAMSRQPKPGQMFIIINNAFPAQLVFFAIGASIYYYRDAVVKLNSTLLSLLFICFVLLEDVFLTRVPNPFLLTGIGLFALFVMFLRAPASRDWLLIRIGKISYSIYLIHFTVLFWVQTHFSNHSQMFIVVGAYAMIFVLANLMYEFIEKPFIRAGKSIAEKSRAALLAPMKA